MRAKIIANALGGRKAGAAWMARCPAHEDREPSLSIIDKDGKVLVRCHARCEQSAVIGALRARGVWDVERPAVHSSHKARRDPSKLGDTETDTARRTEAALAIWNSSRPSGRTPVATYLRSRGLTASIPSSIRFHAGPKHPSGAIWPAMIALVTRGGDGKPIGIHRTFLMPDGSGKAPVEPTKMMLGPCRGGAVRLGEVGDVLMIGEGIETCLAAQQASGRPAWAALSTSGLRALDLPRELRNVIVLADGDDPGEAAAWDCALRWKREGRRVRIARAPQGKDFNDLLLVGEPHVAEAAP